MALEIEKKYRLAEGDRDELLAALRAFGAEYEGEDFEENTIYGNDFLIQKGGVLRIRKTQDRVMLTFKRQVTGHSDAKHQIEYETEVADAGSVENIVHELGLTPRLVYEKRRRTWKFRSTEVVIDELPFGLFMEIEGTLTAIAEAEMLLGAEDLETEPLTYPRLTAQLGTEKNGVREARFERSES
jgi:adenylate cyclase class 2